MREQLVNVLAGLPNNAGMYIQPCAGLGRDVSMQLLFF